MNYAAALSLPNDDNKRERNAAVFRLMEFSERSVCSRFARGTICFVPVFIW